MKLDTSKDQHFKALQKQCTKLYKGLEDPTIKSLIAKESYKLISEIKKETEQLTLEKGVLEKAILKTEEPTKEALNQHNVRKLINLRGEYESTKFNIERLKEKLINTSTNEDLKAEEIEKKVIQYAKFINKNTEKAILLEKSIEKQDVLVKEVPKFEILQITKDYKTEEKSKQEILEKGVNKLEKLLKSKEQVKGITLNSLTKGKYNNLQERKVSFKEKLDPLLEKKQILENNIILSSGFMATLERRRYQKELKIINEKIQPYEDRYNALKKEEINLVEKLDPKIVASKTAEVHQSLSKALYKAKGELSASKSKSFVSSNLERSTYKELPKRYSGHNSKHNTNALREIDKLLKDDVNLSNARQDLRNKIFKRGREEDVAELER